MTSAVATPLSWHAPSAWRAIDFISDLHLAGDTPLTFDGWASYMRGTAADAILILGDLFEAWVGDDSRSDPFEARCVEVLKNAAARCTVAFMAGNRDFLVGGAMLHDCGVEALTDPTVVEAFDDRILLTHGDAMCVADVEYQQFRRTARTIAWQRGFLGRPIDERRALARTMRVASEQRKSAGTAWFDIDAEVALAELRIADATTIVHGHTHRPASEPIGVGCSRHVLSDWDLDDAQAPRAEVLRWTKRGFARLSPEQAGRDTD